MKWLPITPVVVMPGTIKDREDRVTRRKMTEVDE